MDDDAPTLIRLLAAPAAPASRPGAILGLLLLTAFVLWIARSRRPAHADLLRGRRMMASNWTAPPVPRSCLTDLEPVTVAASPCAEVGERAAGLRDGQRVVSGGHLIGHASLLLAFRKTSSLWRCSWRRDPVSNRQFVALLPAFSRALARDIPAGPVPAPATLRSPGNGRFPLPAKGARFGDFVWQASASEDVVAEIAEFSYHDEARLVLLRSLNPGEPRTVSSGQLWTTGGEWPCRGSKLGTASRRRSDFARSAGFVETAFTWRSVRCASRRASQPA